MVVLDDEKMQSRERNQNFRSHAIRGYCCEQILEDFNTKCCVMNNEEKLFQQKQSLETLFLLMKKTRAKKFKVRMFYHLRNLFGWSGGFWLGGFCLGIFCQGVYFRGFFVLIPLILFEFESWKEC